MYCPKCKQQTLTLYMGGNFGTYLCKNCGYIGPLFVEEVPTKKREVPAYYRAEFTSVLVYLYDFSFKLFCLGREKQVRRLFLKHIPKKSKAIIDMATGTGEVALTIKKALPQATIIGIDLSETMLSIAYKKTEKQKLKVRYLLRNIEKTGFKGNSFDIVTLSFGLHELPLPHRKNVIKEAYRILKKGGKFLIMDYHLPKSKIAQMFLYSHIWLVEKYAKSILYQELEKEMEKYGFKKTKKEIFYAGLIQLVEGEK